MRRRLERAGAIPHHEPPRVARAHHQDLVDLEAGSEVADEHGDEP